MVLKGQTESRREKDSEREMSGTYIAALLGSYVDARRHHSCLETLCIMDWAGETLFLSFHFEHCC